MFDLLGLDWGEKFFGMAFGSSQTRLCIPSQKEYPASNFWQEIEIEIENRKIKKIILGFPTNFKNNLTENSVKVKNFQRELQQKFDNIEVVLIDERGTSKDSAKKYSPKNFMIHNLCALEIIERYFSWT
jgi:putative transcription antitermination factor YqgF